MDDIRSLKTPWVPLGKELGGMKWRLKYSNTAYELLAEHFGGEAKAGEALVSLLKPGPKRISTLVAYLWAGMQADAWEKWRAGKLVEETVELDQVYTWLPQDRDELQAWFAEEFGSIGKAVQISKPSPNG